MLDAGAAAAAALYVLLLLAPVQIREVASSASSSAVMKQMSMQCTAGTEKSGSGTTANWPTYHFMNNVTRNASGALLLEPLNDANAIAEYKGKLLWWCYSDPVPRLFTCTTVVPAD